MSSERESNFPILSTVGVSRHVSAVVFCLLILGISAILRTLDYQLFVVNFRAPETVEIVCLFVLGLTLLIGNRNTHWGRMGCSLSLAALFCIFLVDVTGLSSLFSPPVQDSLQFPLFSALCFAFLFSGLHRHFQSPSSSQAAVLAATSLSLTIVGLSSNWLTFETIFPWIKSIQIPFAMGVGILIVAGNLLITGWQSADRRATNLTPWAPAFVFLMSFTTVNLVYVVVVDAELTKLQMKTQTSADFLQDYFEAENASALGTLTRIAARSSDGIFSPAKWKRAKENYFAHFPGLQVLGMSNPSGKTETQNTVIPSSEGIQRKLILELRSVWRNPRFLQSKEPVVRTLRSGDSHDVYVLQMVPVVNNGKARKAVFALYNGNTRFDQLANRKFIENYHLMITALDSGETQYTTDKSGSFEARGIKSRFQTKSANHTWEFLLYPKRSVLKNVKQRVALAIYPAGIILCILLSLLIHYIRLAEVRHSQERSYGSKLSAILSGSTRVAIVATDTTGTITHFNSGAEKMLGYSQEEVVNKKTPIIFHLDSEIRERIGKDSPQDDPEVFFDLIGEAKSGNFEERQWTYIRKDGTQLPVNIIITPILEDNHHVGFLEMAIDVTGPERTLREYSNKLKQSNQELEEFNYIASHDLKEPVRNLVSYSSLLEEDLGDDLPEIAREDLHFIKSSAKRIQSLIDDLLQLSRAGAKAMKFNDIASSTLVKFSVNSLRVAIDESDATIDIMDPLPIIKGDKTTLSLLFLNLIGNGIKFRRPEETPMIQIRYTDEGKNHHFSIHDNGIGIDEKYLESIFSPFKRLHGVDRYPGTGVGLAICKKIVVRHHGKIWAESTVGKGSEFHFTLPKERSQA